MCELASPMKVLNKNILLTFRLLLKHYFCDE